MVSFAYQVVSSNIENNKMGCTRCGADSAVIIVAEQRLFEDLTGLDILDLYGNGLLLVVLDHTPGA